MNYTARKSALVIVFLLAFTVSARAQTAPTPEQLDFVNVLGGRVRAASEAEVAALNDQLKQPIALEKQLEEDSLKLERQIAQLSGRIETLSSVAANCPAMRTAIDQAERQANQGLKDRLALLKKTNDDLNEARQRRLKAEKAAAWQQGNSTQLINDFDYLYKMWRMDPPQHTWQAMMDRLTEVARNKKLKSKVTVSTGAVAMPIKYQLVSGGQIYSAVNGVPCLLDAGNYNFWIDKPGTADSSKKSYLVFRETQPIDLSQP